MNRCILSPTALAKLVEYGKLELKFSIEDWLKIALSHLNLRTIDLDVDSAFELAQIQRQLSRWDVHWLETWRSDASRIEISTLSRVWANRIREMAGVFV
jgi:hypothetical protein